jgi:hypothetical protein
MRKIYSQRRDTGGARFPASGASLVATDCVVLFSTPPYGLAQTPFRFAALAALAGRAPLGGRREVALATYLAARLADGVLDESGLAVPTRVERAGNARSWLSTIAIPAPIRQPLARLIDASAGGATEASQAVRAVIAVTAEYLDRAARLELENLAETLESQALAK